VTVSDPKSRVLQIQGPASLKVMKAATHGAVDKRMGYFHSGFFRIAGQEVYVSRTGWTGELGYEIYTQGSATDCGKLWDHLMAAGKPHGMEFGSLASMEIRRIEAGILDNGTDFDTSMTPFDAGLGAFVDTDKDEFIGRAALLKAGRGKSLFGLTCAEAAPGYRCEIMEGDKAVGFVTASAWSPYLKTGIGYARFTTPGDWAGRKLRVKAGDCGSHACAIIDLPFYDKEKLIPRGLAKDVP
jgi:aminomethyltransferase